MLTNSIPAAEGRVKLQEVGFNRNQSAEFEWELKQRSLSSRPLMNIDEAADFLRTKKSTLYQLLCRGRIPASKIGRRWVFELEQLLRWVKSQRRHEIQG